MATINSSKESTRRGTKNTQRGLMNLVRCAMIDRCHNSGSRFFGPYGGRGIQVCQRWRDSLDAFIQDMGPRPDGMTVERIDNNGNYEPSNCRWATRSEQARNRRSNRLITVGNKTATLVEWEEITGIPRQTIVDRLESGRYTPQEAVSLPARKTKIYRTKRATQESVAEIKRLSSAGLTLKEIAVRIDGSIDLVRGVIGHKADWQTIPRTCSRCGDPFIATTRNKIYCSRKCARPTRISAD